MAFVKEPWIEVFVEWSNATSKQKKTRNGILTARSDIARPFRSVYGVIRQKSVYLKDKLSMKIALQVTATEKKNINSLTQRRSLSLLLNKISLHADTDLRRSSMTKQHNNVVLKSKIFAAWFDKRRCVTV